MQQSTLLTEGQPIVLAIARLMYSGFLYVKLHSFLEIQPGIVDTAAPAFLCKDGGITEWKTDGEDCKWNGVCLLYSTVYCLV